MRTDLEFSAVMGSASSLPMLLKQRRAVKRSLPQGWSIVGTIGSIIFFRNEIVTIDYNGTCYLAQKTGIIMPIDLPDPSEVCAL